MADENGGKTASFFRNIGNNIPMNISLAEASSMFPGFRFSPTDEELIQYYLNKKLQGDDESVELISEVDICRHEPWDLPAQSVVQSDCEWFFFSCRGRKYPNGSQNRRATVSGYWKATGKERDVKSGSNIIGRKRTLVFHTGRAPKGQRTEWIMNEYTTSEKPEEGMVVCRIRKNMDFHLNENPRSNSSSENDLPIVHFNTPALFGNEGDKTSSSHSKDGAGCSSSNNSHSVEVEQIDTGYEEENPNEGRAEDDDCFADIMKDDIIELDDPSLIETVKPLRATAAKLKQVAEATVPFQGTANRRIRFSGQRMGYSPNVQTGTVEDVSIQDAHPERINGNMIDKFKVPFVLVFLVTLILSLLFKGCV